MDPYLAKKGDFPRISDGFSEISVGSKGLITKSVADDRFITGTTICSQRA